MVHASFCAKSANVFKPFIILFAVRYPIVNYNSRNRAPNHKVEHLFSNIIQVSTEAFEPGRNISYDEQDTILLVYHEDKHRVTLKCAGDGFLIDALLRMVILSTSI